MCTAVLIGWDPATPHLVSKDRRHLFVTSCLQSSDCYKVRKQKQWPLSNWREENGPPRRRVWPRWEVGERITGHSECKSGLGGWEALKIPKLAYKLKGTYEAKWPSWKHRRMGKVSMWSYYLLYPMFRNIVQNLWYSPVIICCYYCCSIFSISGCHY